LLQDKGTAWHLSSRFGHGFVCLVFGGVGPDLSDVGVSVLSISPGMDAQDQAWQRFGLQRPDEPALVLVRPDGYVMGRWHGLDPAPLRAALKDTGVIA
jgi:3-(3-hydroxy-phenyl)propionate hydroxylase